MEKEQTEQTMVRLAEVQKRLVHLTEEILKLEKEKEHLQVILREYNQESKNFRLNSDTFYFLW